MPKRDLAVAQPSEFLRAVREPSGNLKERYRNDPIGLGERMGLKFPEKPGKVMKQLGVYNEEEMGPVFPGLRDLVEDVCLGLTHSAAVIGPRGGGKSLGVSFIEFFLVFIERYDALNLGGSELQADQVYQYLLNYIQSDPYWNSLVKGETLQSITKTVDDAWIRVLTASQKSVRSPHAGGKKKDGRMAGGLLVIDEEAEASPEIVSAALPTINTARPSVNVRCSTFHNAMGSFADLIDNHETMGYKLYKWDIIDICEGCDCRDSCENEETCFREDHYEDFVNPETGEAERKLLHRAYCGGRAKYADGWIPMEEILKLWRRIKRNHSVWEVEAMGSRPSTSGHVIKDRVKYAANITQSPASSLYEPGYPISVCVDWGSVAAGVEVWQEQLKDTHVLLRADLLEEAGLNQILGVIINYYNSYPECIEVAADIGGGGNYLNPALRDNHGIPVRDVNFNEEKESAAAAWNVYNEAGKVIYPAEFTDFHEQSKRWRRKNGRIQKGNDHMMDAGVCYFSKFIDRLGIVRNRVKPRAASTGLPGTQEQSVAPRVRSSRRGSSGTVSRRPMARPIGGSRNRNR